jgi:hypothetical protein
MHMERLGAMKLPRRRLNATRVSQIAATSFDLLVLMMELVQNLSIWDYCGVVGSTQDELRFNVVGGVCPPVTHKTVHNVCGGSSHSFPPHSYPIFITNCCANESPYRTPYVLPDSVRASNPPTKVPTASPTVASTNGPTVHPLSLHLHLQQ